MFPNGPKDIINIVATPHVRNPAHQKRFSDCQYTESSEVSHDNCHWQLIANMCTLPIDAQLPADYDNWSTD